MIYLLFALTAISGAWADYDCLCSSELEAHIFARPDNTSRVMGYMYEFDCKPTVTVAGLETGYTAVAHNHQVDYVMSSPQLQKLLCQGSPAYQDTISSTTAATAVTTTTTTATTTSIANITTRVSNTTTTPVVRTNVSTTSTRNTTTITTPTPDALTATSPTAPVTNITISITSRASTKQLVTSQIAHMFSTRASTQKTTHKLTTKSTNPVTTTHKLTKKSTSPATTTHKLTMKSTTPVTTTHKLTTKSTTPVTTTHTLNTKSTTPVMTTHRFTTKSTTPITTPTTGSTTIHMPIVTHPSSPHGNIRLCPPSLLTSSIQPEHVFQHGIYCYEYVPYLGSWFQAEYNCPKKGGVMLYITDQSDQDFVMTILNTVNYIHPVWLGLHDVTWEEHWEWVSDVPLTYTNWMTSRYVGRHHNHEDCALFVYERRGQWDDVVCQGEMFKIPARHPWICQYNITRALPVVG